MYSYDEAMQRLFSQALKINSKEIPLREALGKIAADDVFSSIDQPGFVGSSMDGYAVFSDNCNKGSILDVIGMSVAGDAPVQIAGCDGQAFAVMTGATIPSGFDAIIPVEDSEKINKSETDKIRLLKDVEKNQFMRPIGSDFRRGEPIINKGQTISPQHIATMTLLGIATVSVYQRITIALFFTGKEIIDDLEQPLAPGQTYNVTGSYFRSLFPTMDINIIDYGVIGDDPPLMKQKLKYCLENDAVDMIISTGAVSKGVLDFVPEVVASVGGALCFHKLAMFPGKPLLSATFDNNTLFFGLPGNPISSIVTFRFVILPYLFHLRTQPKEMHIMARLTDAYHKKSHFRCFLRGLLAISEDGVANVEILTDQASYMLSPSLASNCWLMLEESEKEYKKNDLVSVYPLMPNSLGSINVC